MIHVYSFASAPIHYYKLGEWEMFDLDELHSVYANPQYAKVLNLLKARLATLREQYGVPDPDAGP